MLAIRLQRTGRRHQPAYRIVVAERRSKRGGPPVEDLGFYNPFTKEVGVNKERAAYWIGVGAKPTLTTHNLLVQEGVLEGAKIAVPVRPKKKAEVEKSSEGKQPTEGERPAAGESETKEAGEEGATGEEAKEEKPKAGKEEAKGQAEEILKEEASEEETKEEV